MSSFETNFISFYTRIWNQYERVYEEFLDYQTLGDDIGDAT